MTCQYRLYGRSSARMSFPRQLLGSEVSRPPAAGAPNAMVNLHILQHPDLPVPSSRENTSVRAFPVAAAD